MNEEDYEVDENKKPVNFRQRIFPKEEEVGVCAECDPHHPRSGSTASSPLLLSVSNNLTDCPTYFSK